MVIQLTFTTPASGGRQMATDSRAESLGQYEGVFRFHDRDYYDRHLVFDHVVTLEQADQRQRFEAMARSLRDLLTQRWLLTQDTHDRANPKQVYYLSMEFLIGRTLLNAITNLGVQSFVDEDLRSDPHQEWHQLLEEEPDAGLGNGGLGRLAACFLDSLATLEIPAIGYGLRYEYGMFRQEIRNGQQFEQPDNWLPHPDPWEVARTTESVEVSLSSSVRFQDGKLQSIPGQPFTWWACPTTGPSSVMEAGRSTRCGCGRPPLPSLFDFGEFSQGEFFAAVLDKIMAESLTRVLYPDDSTPRGRSLRFLQEYFLVACSLADIVRRFKHRGNRWPALPEKVAIQLNDTHPAMAVAELMRILLDQAHLGWDEAWDLTVRTLAYTNHTLLPEALEKWPVELFEHFLPRHLEMIYEINAGFLRDVQAAYPGDADRLRRMSLIEESPVRQVRMANLAIVGTHSTNGVAEIHSRPASRENGGRLCGHVSRAVQQQDQWRDAPPLAAAGQPRPREPAHRGRRRGVGDGSRSAPLTPLSPTTPAFATASARPSSLPRAVRRSGSRTNMASSWT